ncbi:MAG: formate dehydrogenase-N subunit alpha [Thiobacillus sp. 65-69]|nr:formate dehydrogenase-N subunit alpha [Thiobacillus sp.]ODU89256.1 MAG: formate dehydrogenase-N subunit alpha [Thiobacillus sp. SCN 65-179]OJW34569.1 MAG: formate dehydrogenase-N subunit alpha [Thiobacillus sp. 65-69]
MASLAPTFGRGAMTNHWVDIKNTDLVLIMGGNAAEAHPCGFKWVTEAKAHRKAKLIVVDPRFTRSAAVSDYYAPIRAGTDIAFLGGVINYLLSHDRIHHEYVKNYTDFSFLVKDEFAFENGIYSGYNPEARKYDKSSWGYQIGSDGYVVTDPSLENPRCVYQLMKAHYSRYTPEMVSTICGTPRDAFLKVCEMIATTAAADKTMTVMYALGWTQHSQGSQMIRTGAMVQLLLGNIGAAGGGMNALRGHSNIQGLTDLGLLSNLLPGYMTLPGDAEQDYKAYIDKRAFKPLRPGQLSYWSNYGKFFVSTMKAWYGDSATAGNNWCYDWLPKLDKGYDILQVFENMNQGKMNGYICQGFNPLASAPCKIKVSTGLSKLKYLVIIDPLETETAEFWQNHGEYNDVDPAKIQTEVFRLPSTCFAEEDGSLVNSGRWLQWHWKAAEPPGDARGDQEIMAGIFLKLKAMYKKEGGAFPEPILNLTWRHKQPDAPSPEELAREFSGRALKDVTDPKDPTRVLVKAGEQLNGFAELRDDGSTICGCWLFAGAWTEKGNMMARRDNSDPFGIGQTLNWAFSWPANRRVLYNRASCDLNGKPYDPARKLIAWDAASGKWSGSDIPDFKADSSPEDGMSPFIMNPEGVARFFALDKMAEGPFPEHYEPFESPIANNPLHPSNEAARANPAARVFKDDWATFGKPDKFPHVCTTYRLTEHFHFWTKHVQLNAIVQPEQFVEIDEELAQQKGIKAGDHVRVKSNRGFIVSVAVVTKRLRTLDIAGKKVHTVGVPIHWGFVGLARNGYITNTLTPFVGDGNTQTPEFKSFLVDLEKV